MTRMRTLGQLVSVELKLFLREPIAVFFAVVFPFIPLLVIGTLFGRADAMEGFRVIDAYVPALIAMVTAYLGLMGIPIALSEYRSQGVLRRFRVSPMPLWTVLLAHIAVQLSLLVVVSALLVGVADLAFGLRFAGNPGWIVVTVLAGCLALFTLGFAVIGVLSSPRAAQSVGSVLFFLMLFTSGTAIPRRQFPPWLKEATDWVPLSHLVDALTVAWIGQPQHEAYAPLGILVGLGVLAFVVAALTFRWDG